MAAFASVLVLATSAMAQSFGGSWTYSFTVGTASPNPVISVASANPSKAGASSDLEDDETSTASGATSVQCTYSPASGDPVVLYAAVQLTVSASCGGAAGGTVSDGFSDQVQNSGLGPNEQYYSASGTHWMTQFYECDASNNYTFTVSIPAESASAPPGHLGAGGGKEASYANCSCTVIPYLVGITSTGTTLVSRKASIISGQPFTASIVTNIPSAQRDSYTWQSPSPGDAALPFGSWTCNSSPCVFSAFTEPTGSSLSCFFGLQSGTQNEQVKCTYYSANVTKSVGLALAGGVNVCAPTVTLNKPNYGDNATGYGTLLSQLGENGGTDNAASPGAMELWHNPVFTSHIDGVNQDDLVSDPPGFSGQGQWGFFSVFQSGSYWENPNSQTPLVGLDNWMPYKYTYGSTGTCYSGAYCSSGSEAVFSDNPSILTGSYNVGDQGVMAYVVYTYIIYIPPGSGVNPMAIPAFTWNCDGLCAKPASGPWASQADVDTGSGVAGIEAAGLPFPSWTNVLSNTLSGPMK